MNPSLIQMYGITQVLVQTWFEQELINIIAAIKGAITLSKRTNFVIQNYLFLE